MKGRNFLGPIKVMGKSVFYEGNLTPFDITTDNLITANKKINLGSTNAFISGTGADIDITAMGVIHINADSNSNDAGQQLIMQAGANILQITGGATQVAGALTYNGNTVLHSGLTIAGDTYGLVDITNAQSIAGEKTFTDIGKFILDDGPTPLTIERTDDNKNISISFKDSDNQIFLGLGASGVLKVGTDSNLETNGALVYTSENFTLDELEFNKITNTTGIIQGTVITRVDNTHIALSSGKIQYTTYDNIGTPVVHTIDVIAVPSILIPNTVLLNNLKSYFTLLLNPGDQSYTQEWITDPSDLLNTRSRVLLGSVHHYDNIKINDVQTIQIREGQVLDRLYAWHDQTEIVHGLVYGGNGDLSLNRSLGTLRGMGINADSIEAGNWYENPDIGNLIAINEVEWVDGIRDGSGSLTLTLPTGNNTFLPNKLDNGTGILETVTADTKAINHRLYIDNKGNTLVLRGQTLYESLDLAINARVSREDQPLDIPASFIRDFILRSVISVRTDATDLSDPAQAVFYTPILNSGYELGQLNSLIDSDIRITKLDYTHISGTTSKALFDSIDSKFTDITGDAETYLSFGLIEDDLEKAMLNDQENTITTTTPFTFTGTDRVLLGDHQGDSPAEGYELIRSHASTFVDTDNYGMLYLTRTNHTTPNPVDVTPGSGLFFKLKMDNGTSRIYGGVGGSKTGDGTGQVDFYGVDKARLGHWDDEGLTVNGNGRFNNLIYSIQATTPDHEPGQLWYDGKTLWLDTEPPNMRLPVGQGEFRCVRNITGSTIPALTVIHPNGSDSGLSTVAPSLALYEEQVIMIGVVLYDIPTGENGWVITSGGIGGIDTSPFGENDFLYLSDITPGLLTTDRPVRGASYEVLVGKVRDSDPINGAMGIFIRISHDTEETHNINGFPTEHQSDMYITNTDATRTLTLTPTNALNSFHFYISGTKYVKVGPQTIQWSDVHGDHYFYYDEADGEIHEIVNPSETEIGEVFIRQCAIAYIYWDKYYQESVGGIGDERHGLDMPPSVHQYNHLFFGTQYLNGMQPHSYLVDTPSASSLTGKLGIVTGIAYDEDIQHVMATRLIDDSIMIFYNDGINGDIKMTQSLPGFIHALYTGPGAGGLIAYNKFGPIEDSAWYTGSLATLVALQASTPQDGSYTYVVETTSTWRFLDGVWYDIEVPITSNTWSLEEAGDKDYVLSHIFGTNFIVDSIANTKAYAAKMGQVLYDRKTDARLGANTEAAALFSQLHFPELVLIATFNGYTANNQNQSDLKIKFVSVEDGSDYVDWRGSASIKSSGSSTNSHLNLLDTSAPNLHPAASITFNNQHTLYLATNLQEAYDEIYDKMVDQTRDQSIGGIKTFTDTPVLNSGMSFLQDVNTVLHFNNAADDENPGSITFITSATASYFSIDNSITITDGHTLNTEKIWLAETGSGTAPIGVGITRYDDKASVIISTQQGTGYSEIYHSSNKPSGSVLGIRYGRDDVPGVLNFNHIGDIIFNLPPDSTYHDFIVTASAAASVIDVPDDITDTNVDITIHKQDNQQATLKLTRTATNAGYFTYEATAQMGIDKDTLSLFSGWKLSLDAETDQHITGKKYHDNWLYMSPVDIVADDSESQDIHFMYREGSTTKSRAININAVGDLLFNNYKIWTAGNDGDGSGLDADKLEGYHGSINASGDTVLIRDPDGNASIADTLHATEFDFGYDPVSDTIKISFK